MSISDIFRYQEAENATQEWFERSGKHAREWRQSNPEPKPLNDPLMVFAIPLVSKAMTKDWDVAVSCLKRTIKAIRNQTSDSWIAVICGQDRPQGIGFDRQCQFLEFEESFEPGRKDKHPKLHAIANYLLHLEVGDTYTMGLDADDLIHPELVSYVVSDNNGHGYSIGEGYMMDADAGSFARLGTRKLPWQKIHPFYVHCGSCVAVRFDTSRPDGGVPFRHKGNHTQHRQNLAQFGLHIEPIPFPACIYLVNHGENQRERVGRLGGKMSYLQRHRIPKRGTRRIIEDFRLNDLFPEGRS